MIEGIKSNVKLMFLRGQGSKLTLANSQNASAFDNLRVRKMATSKRLRVRIIHVYQTFGKNLLVISPVCQQKKILLAKFCKWTKELTSNPEGQMIQYNLKANSTTILIAENRHQLVAK